MQSREVDTLLATAAARAVPQHAQPDVIAGSVAEIRERIPAMTAAPAIDRLLPEMCTGHAVAIQQLLEHPQPRDEIQLAAVTAPFARDCAVAGVPVAEVLRTYQVGHEFVWRWWTAQIKDTFEDAELREPVVARCAELLLAYVSVGMRLSVDVHTTELERRTRGAAVQQRAEVLSLLDARARVDARRSSVRLQYRIDRHHVAFVLWRPDGAGEEHGHEAIAADWAQRATGCVPLLVAGDVRSLWGWVGGSDGVTVVHQPVAKGWRLAVGQQGPGVVGFRSSHAEAMRARALAQRCDDGARQLFCHHDLETLSLLDDDIEALRRYVGRALGGLACTGDREGRLRTTLAAYLSSGANVRAAARDMSYHRNTIQQRLDLACELRGRPLEDDPLALAVSLEIVGFYGDQVLGSSG